MTTPEPSKASNKIWIGIALASTIVVIAVGIEVFFLYMHSNAIDSASMDAYYQERLQNMITPVATDNKTNDELKAIIENQRGRTYEAYNLEWQFCQGKAGEDVKVESTNAKNWLVDGKVKTEIACIFDNDRAGKYGLELDPLTGEQKETVIIEAPAV